MLFFLENYELAVSRLAGKPRSFSDPQEAEEFARRVKQLDSMQPSSGVEGASDAEKVAAVFARFAREALRESGAAELVNWADVERQAIVECLSELGHAPEAVGAVLSQYSPGVTSEEKRDGLLDDIRRLAPAMKALFESRRGREQ